MFILLLRPHTAFDQNKQLRALSIHIILVLLRIDYTGAREFNSYDGTPTTNCRPLAVSVICPLGGWSTILLDQTASSFAMYFCVFRWIYCYNKCGQEHMFPSRCFGFSRPPSVLVCSNTNTEVGLDNGSIRHREIHCGWQSGPVQYKTVKTRGLNYFFHNPDRYPLPLKSPKNLPIVTLNHF